MHSRAQFFATEMDLGREIQKLLKCATEKLDLKNHLSVVVETEIFLKFSDASRCMHLL